MNMSDVPLKDFNESACQHVLSGLLTDVTLDFGLKPTDREFNHTARRLADIVMRRYGSMTSNDIRSAFERVLLGEVSIPHYNSFTLEWICKVLNDYKMWVAKNNYGRQTETVKDDGGEKSKESKASLRRDIYLAYLEYKYLRRLPANTRDFKGLHGRFLMKCVCDNFGWTDERVSLATRVREIFSDIMDGEYDVRIIL